MKNKTLRSINYVLTVIFFCFTANAGNLLAETQPPVIPPVQDNYWIDSLKIIPDKPLTSDLVKLVVYTKHPSGGCRLLDHQIWNWRNYIFIDATYEQGLLTYICSSVDTIEIGHLLKGNYTLVYDWRDSLSFKVYETPPTCKANFSYYYTRCGSGVRCGDNSIAFVDSSAGNVVRWNWNFGDGSASIQKNPMHQYENSGVYNVCLSIVTEDSCRSTFCDSVFVNVPRCDADFIWHPLLCFVPCPGCYYFEDRSYGDVVKWKWNFGDDSTSREQNTNHCFESNGIYRVSLTIETIDGCTSTSYHDIIVGDTLPACKADFTWSEDTLFYPGMLIMPAHSIQFTDLSFGNVNSWYWNFGDGTGSNEQHPHHDYFSGDIYNVALTINTYDGCTDSITKMLNLTDTLNGCKADFTWEEVYPLCDKKSTDCITPYFYVKFSNASSAGGPFTCNWSFGDGTTSQEIDPIHEYLYAGEYVVTLSITGITTYCYDSVYKIIVVGDTIPGPCNADFNWEEVFPNWDYCLKSTNCITPYHFIQFTNASSGPVNTYYWDFGDGSASNEENPLHTYKYSGIYNVCLSVSGDSINDCGDMICKTVLVGDTTSNECYADFVIADEPVPCYLCLGCYCVKFKSVSSWNTVDFLWDFGDGDTSSMQDPVHMYTWTPGDTFFTVSLIIRTSDNCTDTVSKIYNPGSDTLYSGVKVKNSNDSRLFIYPNPAESDHIYIQIPDNKEFSNLVITIIDLYGRKTDVMSYEINDLNDQLIEYNIANLKDGQYICTIIMDDRIYYGRFIKK